MNLKQVVLFAVGPIGATLLGFVTLPLITWFFEQGDVGRIAMLQLTISCSVLLLSLGLDQAYVREFHEADSQASILKHALVPGLVLLLIAAVVALFLQSSVANWLFGEPEWYLSFLVVISVCASFISRFLSLVLRMKEQGLAFSMSQVLPKLFLIFIIFGYVFVDADKNLINLVVAYTLSLSLVCVIYTWNTRKDWMAALQSKFRFERLKKMFAYGGPLILGSLAFWGLTAVDKIFLRSLNGFEELAIYSVSISFAAAAIILQSVFSTVWAPTVYKWASKGEGAERVRQVSRYMLAIIVMLFAVTGLFSWIITYFLPTNYRPVQWVVVSCIGFPLLYTLSETTVVGIGISRRSWLSMVASTGALAFNVLGNWILVPKYGAAGAAVSTCAAFWLFFVLRTELSIYAWQPIPRTLLYTYSFIVAAGAGVFTLSGEDLGLWFASFWLLVIISWFLVFRSEVQEACRFIHRRVVQNKQ